MARWRPASCCSALLSAQPTKPIYLQYDGYVRNSNGTLTLSFGYFNMNNVDVTIQPGEANAFTPGPGDRNQPVTFLKGTPPLRLQHGGGEELRRQAAVDGEVCRRDAGHDAENARRLVRAGRAQREARERSMSPRPRETSASTAGRSWRS
jgi:hypothetical protein